MDDPTWSAPAARLTPHLLPVPEALLVADSK